MSAPKEDDEGNAVVTVTVSQKTYQLLEELAEFGMFGIGPEGVIEGFVYKGLQRAFGQSQEQEGS